MSTDDAEQSSPQASTSQAVQEAFQLLADTIAEHDDIERPLTASGAYLQMRRKSFGGFDLKTFGYRRFRDFLAEATRAGYVAVDDSHQGDLILHVVESQKKVAPIKPIRPDLWKAFTDWTPGLVRLYDIAQDQVLTTPAEPAPLEPARFKEIRDLRERSPGNFAVISQVELHEQLEWMREFAETVQDLKIRHLLESALASEKPNKLFRAVLRDAPEYQRRWRNIFSSHVRSEIERWRDTVPTSKPIRIDRQVDNESLARPSILTQQSPPSPRGDSTDAARVQQIVRNRGVSTYSDLLTWVTAAHKSRSASDSTDVAMLRSLLHAAIDRMPAEELRNLRLPVGYLFEE